MLAVIALIAISLRSNKAESLEMADCARHAHIPIGEIYDHTAGQQNGMHLISGGPPG
jgi:hypothetical protein